MKRLVAQLRTLFRAGDPRRKVLLYALFASIICGVIEFGAPLDSSLRTARNHARTQPVSGEIVVVVAPADGTEPADADVVDAAILAAGDERPLKEIAAELAERFGMKRRDVYARALDLREADPAGGEG